MKEVKARKKRIVSYDVARALAIVLVVLCHATELTYTLYFKQPEMVGGATKLVASTLFSLGRLGVPIFLFLTGALILRKQIENDDDVLAFYKKNLLPLVIVNASWVIIYNVFFLLNGNVEYVSIGNIIKEMLFMKVVPLMNMWYIPMIVGMYIGLPFVAKIVKTFSKKSLYVGAIIVFVACFVFPFVNLMIKVFGIGGGHLLSSNLNLSFLGGTYGLYIIIGNCLARHKKIKLDSIWVVVGTLTSFLSVCSYQLFTRYGTSFDPEHKIWYDCPAILLCGVCLFILVTRTNFSKLDKRILSLITFVSKASLAIFFMHIIIQLTLVKALEPLKIMTHAKFCATFCISLASSISLCYIISKSKTLSKFVLLIKN